MGQTNHLPCSTVLTKIRGPTVVSLEPGKWYGELGIVTMIQYCFVISPTVVFVKRHSLPHAPLSLYFQAGNQFAALP